MNISAALAALDTQRNKLAANLVTKGVTAAATETLAVLVPKVLTITTGGTGGGTGIMACLVVTKATGIISPFVFNQSNISTSSI